MVGLIPLFAVETLEPEMLSTLPEFRRRLEWFLNTGRTWPPGFALARAGPRRTPAAVAAARPPHEDVCCGACWMKRSSCPTTACAPLSKHHQRPSLRARCGGGSSIRVDYCRPNPIRHVRRQLQLARADLVPGQLPASSNRCRSSTTTTATTSRSSARPGRANSSPSTRSPTS